jgi:hypothetical protein
MLKISVPVNLYSSRDERFTCILEHNISGMSNEEEIYFTQFKFNVLIQDHGFFAGQGMLVDGESCRSGGNIWGKTETLSRRIRF